MSDVQALLADGSWRLDDTGAAVFRLAPDSAARRRELVEQLGADPSDAEQWESVLIEALLTDPATAGLRELELHLTDYHHSARRAAEAIATVPRDRLTSLTFGHDFTYLYAPATTSTGAKFDPLDRLHEGFVHDSRNGLWEALPALRTLTVGGALLFDDIRSDTLTSLTVRGVPLSDGSLVPTAAPALESLRLDVPTDVFGVACPVLQLEELTPSRFPRLRRLDLSRCDFDTSDGEVDEILRATGMAGQLTALALPGDPALR
ncbi:hypothetical protein [Cryptosporangium japonicum]|uniref:hypothetical protein n=1 Tax=Cryptosporangium japonicum TaxID=80872 RepID=UPI0031CDEA3B